MKRLNACKAPSGPVLLAAALVYGFWPPPAAERALWLGSWAALVAVSYAAGALWHRRIRPPAPAASSGRTPDWRTAVAHDVRTPLMRMRLALDALAAEGGRAEAHAATLESEVLRLEHLAEALVDLGTDGEPIDGGGRLDLTTAVRDMVGRAAPFFEASGRLLVGDLNDTPAVAIDLRTAERICDNLLGNALRHGTAGEVTVTVGLDGPLWVRLEVENLSPPPALPLAELRLPFVRGQRVGNDPGFGLGLAVVERLVAPAGGRLLLRHSGGRFAAAVVLPRAPLTAPPL